MLARYIPKHYTLIAKDERFGFEVHGIIGPRTVAIAFGGKRSKPDWHFRFKDEARLHAKIEETLRGYMEWQDRKPNTRQDAMRPTM